MSNLHIVHPTNKAKIVFDILQIVLISFLIYDISLGVFFSGTIVQEQSHKFALISVSLVFFFMDMML